jgi:hypothetical protein
VAVGEREKFAGSQHPEHLTRQKQIDDGVRPPGETVYITVGGV